MENNNSSITLDVLGIIIPIVSVLASYFLGQLQSAIKFRKDQAMQRYNSFYVPLFAHLYAGKMWVRNPHTMNFEARSKILDLFTHNLAMLGPGFQKCYPDLLNAHSSMLLYESRVCGYENAPSEYDRIFRRIVKFAISESKQLSRELHLPPIAKTYEAYLCKERVYKPTKGQSRQK